MNVVYCFNPEEMFMKLDKSERGYISGGKIKELMDKE